MKVKNIEYDNEMEWYEGQFYWNFIGDDIGVIYESKEDFHYGDKCLNQLNNMSDNIKDNLAKYLVVYCVEFQDEVFEEDDEEVIKVEETRDIFEHVEFNYIHIHVPENIDDIIIYLGGECEWEEEHGLEVVIKNGEVIYVGAYGDSGDLDNLSENPCNYVK